MDNGEYKRFEEFFESARSTVARCLAISYKSGQVFRIIISLKSGKEYMIQSDLQEDENIGFLALDINSHTDLSSFNKAMLLEDFEITALDLFKVDGCKSPSRIVLNTSKGQIILSSDGFPYMVSYFHEGKKSGDPQYGDGEYIADYALSRTAR